MLLKRPRGFPARPKKNQSYRVSTALAAGLCVAAIALPVLADDMTALASRLSALRGEVEELGARLSSSSSEQKETLRSLSRQRSELELEATREETRVQKVSSAIAKRRAEIAAEKAKGDRLVPVYDEAFASARGYVEKSLPFRKSERLAALDKIQEQYAGGLLTPARALQRLWSFVEDEFRMTKESGLYKQTIVVDGRERLAEVIRVGMVMLFYKTDDGGIGRVKKQGNRYDYEALLDPEQQKQVLELFTSFKKQLRAGYFELPNGLVEGVQDSASLAPLPVSFESLPPLPALAATAKPEVGAVPRPDAPTPNQPAPAPSEEAKP